MNLPPLRTFLRAAMLASAALVLGAAFSLSAALAQGAAAALAPDRVHIDEILKGLNRGHSFGQVTVSPDGKRLAWIEWTKGGAELRVASLGEPKKSAAGTAA